MATKDILTELQAAGLILELRDNQLVVKYDTISKVSQNTIELLTSKREEIRAILQALDRLREGEQPYIDEEYHRGKGKKGCLVVPTSCAMRYRYWIPPFLCVPIESDDWHSQYQNMPDGEKKKLQWKPLSLGQILEEVNASEELIGMYCKKKS